MNSTNWVTNANFSIFCAMGIFFEMLLFIQKTPYKLSLETPRNTHDVRPCTTQENMILLCCCLHFCFFESTGNIPGIRKMRTAILRKKKPYPSRYKQDHEMVG